MSVVAFAGRLAGMILITGAVFLSSGCAGAGGSAPSSTTSPTASSSTSASTTGEATVVVTVHDVVGLEGGGLAGVLYTGSEMLAANAIGGFGAAVDADPFAVTTPVMEPGPDFEGLFPYVTDTPLVIPSGAYFLILWAADTPLLPYSRWAPGESAEEPVDFFACSVTFDVQSGTVELSIDGVSPEPIGAPIAACKLD